MRKEEKVEQMRQNEEAQYRNKILDADCANYLISHLIKTPSAIWKIGVNECKFLTYYNGYLLKNWDSMRFNGKYRAGVFPDTNEIYDRFAKYYSEIVGDVDVIGVYFNLKEAEFVQDFLNATPVRPIGITSPYMFNYPWTHQLKNKKVLIAHPFTKTIAKQFEKKDKIWNGLLPDLEIDYLTIPQNAGVVPPKFKDWFETLDYLLKEVKKKDFEVMIVGAGAWSLPLILEAKKMGATGIHMGGAVQLLFGIKGAKWHNDEKITKLYNKHWTNVLKSEMPADISKVPHWDKYW